MVAILVLFASGAFKFTQLQFENWPLLSVWSVRLIIAGTITLVGWWIAFRSIHWPVFADFLVSVEAEMVKVSWPSKVEVYSSTLVVLAMFVILAAVIFAWDVVLVFVFRWLGIIAAA